MGNTLTDQQIMQYKNETQFTPSQIKKIHKKFLALDVQNKGFVSSQDMIPILQNHRYSPLLINLISNKKNQQIDFVQLMHVLNQIQFGDKNQLFCKIIDQDKDGQIGIDDLASAISTLQPQCYSKSYEMADQLCSKPLSYTNFTDIILQ
ncbi:Ca2+-binding actin-bundling protein (actinin) [Paramecium bursaria]